MTIMRQVKSLKTLMALSILFILGTSLTLLPVKASTGFILINTATGPSAVGQHIPAGGDVNLYFGNVAWSGAQFYLLTSTNGFSDNTGTQYSPIFTIADITQPA